MSKHFLLLASIPLVLVLLGAQNQTSEDSSSGFLGTAEGNSKEMIKQGHHIFRFDTFGDEAFWGGKLKLHETINHLTPRQALELGLKVDSDALPPAVIEAIKQGKVKDAAAELADAALLRFLN
jgi:hypothetical protein